MRGDRRFFTACAALMLFLPAAAVRHPAEAPASDAPAPLSGSYRVLLTASGTVAEAPLREYLIGAAGAEMPASYAEDALRAQVIACHTYAERIRQMHDSAPDPSLKGADFSDDAGVYQAFFTEDDLRSFYGDAFDESYARLAAAVDAVGDLLLYYDGEPIIAAFHAVSSGRTESAETVWGTSLPYLVSVDSAADCRSPQYAETVTLPPETVRRALESASAACILPDDPAEWFSEPAVSPAGTVLRITAGDTVWSGQQLRTVLGLRSACFTVQYDAGAFRFETKGFGHDVGMSQYGADALARIGKSYDEILSHYYPETVLLSCRNI